MPDRRRHRGAHPQDARDFGAKHLPALRRAAADFAWLLSRGYAERASLKLVGDRFHLRTRQREALVRSTVGDPVRDARRAREVGAGDVRGLRLHIDGYNVLLTVESALGGGVVVAARDGAFRDLASMRGHYKRVEETRGALELLGRFLADAGCMEAAWYLDRPISNSGRLKRLMLDLAAERAWPWTVELSASPDRELAERGEAGELVATADGWILNRDLHWLSLARHVVEAHVDEAWILDLR